MKTCKSYFQLLWLLLAIAGLSACTSLAIPSPTLSVSPLMAPKSTEGLPLSAAASPLPTATSESPVGQVTSDTSPLPLPSVTPIRFRLDQPLLPGATRVTGQGLAGQKITIVDVSLGAEEIGTGEIGADGTFSVEVKPLPAGDRIGIMAGGPLPPGFDTHLDLLWGEGGIQLPMLGNVFASAMVQQP